MRRAARTDNNHAEIVAAPNWRLRNLEKAAEVNKRKLEALPKWECASCGKQAPATVHQKRKTYCSRECMARSYSELMRGAGNPNHRNAAERACENCGVSFSSYSKDRKYCSHYCYTRSPSMRGRLRKDANHKEIVDALLAVGCSVIDMSKLGGGVPDIAACWRGVWYVMEIKNPKTGYGRKGMNSRQKEWAAAHPAPVHVVKSVDEALQAIGAVAVPSRYALDNCS